MAVNILSEIPTKPITLETIYKTLRKTDIIDEQEFKEFVVSIESNPTKWIRLFLEKDNNQRNISTTYRDLNTAISALNQSIRQFSRLLKKNLSEEDKKIIMTLRDTLKQQHETLIRQKSLQPRSIDYHEFTVVVSEIRRTKLGLEKTPDVIYIHSLRLDNAQRKQIYPNLQQHIENQSLTLLEYKSELISGYTTYYNSIDASLRPPDKPETYQKHVESILDSVREFDVLIEDNQDIAFFVFKQDNKLCLVPIEQDDDYDEIIYWLPEQAYSMLKLFKIQMATDIMVLYSDYDLRFEVIFPNKTKEYLADEEDKHTKWIALDDTHQMLLFDQNAKPKTKLDNSATCIA